MILIKPKNGAQVLDSKTRKPVDSEKGIMVDESDVYWHRRVLDGSMEVVTTPAPAAPAAPSDLESGGDKGKSKNSTVK